MAKKSNVSIPAINVIRGIVFLFIGLTGFLVYTRTVEFLTTSPIFAVRDVVIDASIQFIDTTDLRRLKGKNIFRVDIRGIQKRLQSQYPQIDQLRVIRELPGRIKVLARKREALFQIPAKGKILLVDTYGKGMYYVAGPAALPFVKASLNGESLKSARDLIAYFRSRPHLAGFQILSVDLNNSTRVEIVLKPALQLIFDVGDYQPKMDMLDMLVAQKKIDVARLKYIDLRFNEPVLGEDTGSNAEGRGAGQSP